MRNAFGKFEELHEVYYRDKQYINVHEACLVLLSPTLSRVAKYGW